MAQKYRHENTSVSAVNYHLVWIVRRRRSILKGTLDSRAKELIQEKAEAMGCQVLALETDLNHVHLFVNCPPTYSPAYVVQQVKRYSSHALRVEFPWLKAKLPSLWTRAYFAATTGRVSGDTIKRYVESQKSK
ncbi:MAG: IS200/IS605 family transposase [Thermosynechococcaceae cyanobacterium]